MNKAKSKMIQNYKHKLVKFYGLSANLPISMIVDRVIDMTGHPLRAFELTGIFLEVSINGNNFKDVSVDFIDERIWAQIAKNAKYNRESNQHYFPMNNGNVYVDIPEDMYHQRSIVPVNKIETVNELYNVKVEHPLMYDLVKFVELVERFLDVRNHATTSTNEIKSIQVNKNCSYLTFNDAMIRDDFVAWMDMKLQHKTITIFHQPIIVTKTVFDEEKETKRQNRQQTTAIEKYHEKCDDRVRNKYHEDREKGQRKDKSFIEYKQGRKEAGNAKYIKGKSNENQKAVIQSEEVIERDKFTAERTIVKRKHEEHPTDRDEPKKKLPRRYKFTIQSRAMRKMFSLLGSGRYDVNLEEN